MGLASDIGSDVGADIGDLGQKAIDAAELVVSHAKKNYLTNARDKGGLNVHKGHLRAGTGYTKVKKSRHEHFVQLFVGQSYGVHWELKAKKRRPFLEPSFLDLEKDIDSIFKR